jgi:SAM-dependent methyltransferase
VGLKLNLGCGRSCIPGWVNVDAAPLPGVDVVADLERCRTQRLPFGDDAADELLLSHVIEHLDDTLGVMQELHRIARPGAIATIRCPYGASDDADEDPTHRRRYFLNSFGYFSQPAYWRADYGYRGDWQPRRIVLLVDQQENAGLAPSDVLRKVRTLRNVVLEMVAKLEAVKPIRPPDRALQQAPSIEIAYQTPSRPQGQPSAVPPAEPGRDALRWELSPVQVGSGPQPSAEPVPSRESTGGR